ncbi:CAP domain-containing protein [Pseudogemmobacter sonorensis]|uniref:CAP domain-containing protein n=1 Tax=Pseudogemmobacter sonorensis TaxID=2989681 RepID=UPI0036894F3B
MTILLLSGCVVGGAGAPRLDASGASVRGVYPVTEQNIEAVRGRALETVNAARARAGLAPVVMDPRLIAAADVQSFEMSAQRRAWHFGRDGSSPLDRARRAGFTGTILGELVSQTYETEVQAISTWMGQPEQRAILLDPRARRIGLGAYQEEDHKLWWTLNVAD